MEDSARAVALSPTVPMLYQFAPPSVEYCQAPCVAAFAILPTIASPAKEAPASTSASVTLLSESSCAIVRPVGLAVSSATVARVRFPVSPGASFTGVTVMVAVIDLVIALTLSENAVVPPPAPGVTNDPAVPLD